MRIGRWLILAAWLLAGLCARADTVKLKDGTSVEGEITAEDDSTVSILLEFAGGTISETRHISKTDIARIARWTPAQRAEWETTRDYEALQKYQLNPVNSYQAEYYDQVISNAFLAFLAKHPNSPDASNVTARIVEWKAERNLVAAGNVKFHGRWSPAAEVAPQMEHEWGQQLLQEGRELIARRQFEAAVQRLQFVARMDRQPELAALARPLLVSAYQSATNLLDRQERQLARQVAPARDQVDQAQRALRAAEATLAQSTGGDSQTVAQAKIAVDQARAKRNAAQDQFDFTVRQRDTLQQRLAALKSQPPVLTAPASAPQTAKAEPTTSPSPSPTTDSPDVISGLVAWVRRNWVAMVVIAAGIVFLISRLLIKD